MVSVGRHRPRPLSISNPLKTRPYLGRFHYWLPEGQVTTAQPSVHRRRDGTSLDRKKRQPSAAVAERSALVHLSIPPYPGPKMPACPGALQARGQMHHPVRRKTMSIRCYFCGYWAWAALSISHHQYITSQSLCQCYGISPVVFTKWFLGFLSRATRYPRVASPPHSSATSYRSLPLL